MEPTLGELGRAIAELHNDVHDLSDRVDKVREAADRTYLRQDVADVERRAIEVQLQGFETEVHSLHNRVDGTKQELLTRIAQHDAEHQRQDERQQLELTARTDDRKQFARMLTAAILSPLVTGIITVLIVLTVHK